MWNYHLTIFLSSISWFQSSKFIPSLYRTAIIILFTIILIINRAQLVVAALFLITSSLAVFSLLLWAGFDPNWWSPQTPSDSWLLSSLHSTSTRGSHSSSKRVNFQKSSKRPLTPPPNFRRYCDFLGTPPWSFFFPKIHPFWWEMASLTRHCAIFFAHNDQLPQNQKSISI